MAMHQHFETVVRFHPTRRLFLLILFSTQVDHGRVAGGRLMSLSLME